MMRRSLVFAVVALLALGVGPTPASHLKEQPRKHKVVYHLSEAGVDKARFVLGNIQNTITMKAFALTLEQLPPGARHLPQGGVVCIMELVEPGYVYLRP
jgi:intracellular sulfur oxidation DsrE/DsrF family protein